jgi:drug/metabolite transporter (DMT)-like permease
MVYFIYFFSLVALSQSAIIVRISGLQTPEALGFCRMALVAFAVSLWAIVRGTELDSAAPHDSPGADRDSAWASQACEPESSEKVLPHSRPVGVSGQDHLLASPINIANSHANRGRKNQITKLQGSRVLGRLRALSGAGVSPSDWWWTIAGGAIFGVHLWTYFLAAHNTTVANCVILFAVNPVFVSLGSWLFFGERITRRLIFSYFLCLLGLVWLTQQAPPQAAVYPEFGDAMALVAAVTFAGFALVGKKTRGRLGNVRFTVLTNVSGSLVFALGAIWVWAQTESNPFDMPQQAWVAIALMAMFPSILGHSLFTYCMRFMNLSLMSCGKLLEPAMAMVSAAILFGEGASPTALAAFVLIALGILNLFR